MKMEIKIEEKKKTFKKSEVGKIVPEVNRDMLEKFIIDYKKHSKSSGNPKNIVHDLNSLYTKEFFNQLKPILGKSETFNKEKKVNRLKIQKKIDSLFLLESHYKYYHKKSTHNQKPILNILEKEWNCFNKEYNSSKTLASSKQNVAKKFFIYKIEEYLKFLLLNNPILNSVLQNKEIQLLKKIDYKNIILNINVQELFLLLCSCALRIAYNRLVTGVEDINSEIDSIEPGDSYLKVESFELKNVFKFRFLYFLISQIIIELNSLYESDSNKIQNSLNSELISLKKELELLKKKSNPILINDNINQLEVKIDTLKKNIKENKLSDDYLFLRLTVVIGHLKKHKSLIETDLEFEMFEGACLSILDIFEKTVVSHKYNIYSRDSLGKAKTITILKLPDGLRRIYSFSDHLPRVCEPENWSLEGTIGDKSLGKTVQFGFAEAKYDVKTIESINITQKKKFKINENFLELLKDLDSKALEETKDLNLPFSTKAELEQKNSRIDSLEKELNLSFQKRKMITNLYKYEQFINSNLGREFRYNLFWKKILEILTPLENFKFNIFKKELEEFAVLKLQKQIFNTMILCAECYKGFPLYFDTYTDYRGRLYPGLYLFSRTTGFYKYLVSDFKEIKLSSSGFYHMLRAYFKLSPELLNLLEKNWSLDEYYNFFIHNNPNYNKPKKNILYFLLLEKTIYNLKEKKFRTFISLEIDQTGSHAVFTSLILGNEDLAAQTNLFGVGPQDVNKYLLSRFDDFVKEQIKKETSEKITINETEKKKPVRWQDITPRLLKLFSTERDLPKKTFMTYNYSQGSERRSKKLIEIVLEHIPDLTTIERNMLFKIGYNYTKYLDFCFKDFKNQLNAFQKCYNVFSDISHRTAIRSLDGTLFQWEFYYLKTHTGSRYNPITNKNQNYKKTKPFTVISEKIYIKQLEDSIQAVLNDLALHNEKDQVPLLFWSKQKKLKSLSKTLKNFKISSNELKNRKSRVFRPGFVHCLDASIIRLLILKMYKNHNYYINHVHDSIQAHPNQIDNVYQEIGEVYNELNNIDLFDLFLKPSEELLTNSEKDLFRKSVNEFLNLRKNFKIKVIPENMYPYE